MKAPRPPLPTLCLAGRHDVRPPCAREEPFCRGAVLAIEPERRGLGDAVHRDRLRQTLHGDGCPTIDGRRGRCVRQRDGESFFASLECEQLIDRRILRTKTEARHALFGYIEGWYNPRRIQAGLGGLSPDEYEDQYHRQQHNPDR